jgi:DNA-binding FrmR family transcriptional regulator
MGFFDGMVKRLEKENEIADLRERVAALESQVSEIRRLAIQEILKEFRTATNEVGDLLHPRFEEYGQVMCDLLESKQATTLRGLRASGGLI